MKNAGLHGRGEGGVQREKREMSMTGAEEIIWAWDRPQLTRGQNRQQRRKRMPNVGDSDSQRKS